MSQHKDPPPTREQLVAITVAALDLSMVLGYDPGLGGLRNETVQAFLVLQRAIIGYGENVLEGRKPKLTVVRPDDPYDKCRFCNNRTEITHKCCMETK